MNDKIRNPLKKLLNTQLKNQTLILIFEEEINDASWGAWFGPIQKALRLGHWNNSPFSHCHVDLSSYQWADPLPLMSLSISLAEFEQKGGSVTLNLPSNNSTEIKCKRLLKYMAREGFISLFADRIITRLPFKNGGINIKSVNRMVKIEGKPITKELSDKLRGCTKTQLPR